MASALILEFARLHKLSIPISLLGPLTMDCFNPARDIAPCLFFSVVGRGAVPFPVNGYGWPDGLASLLASARSDTTPDLTGACAGWLDRLAPHAVIDMAMRDFKMSRLGQSKGPMASAVGGKLDGRAAI